MLTSKRSLPTHHLPRPQVLAVLAAALGAPGCGADDGAELASSDGAPLGSLEQAFGEATCGTTKLVDAELKRDVTYITPAGYTNPDCKHSAVLDAPDLVYRDDIVDVSWWDTTPVGEKACSRQLLRASFLAEDLLDPSTRTDIAYLESRGEWRKDGTCVVPSLRLDYCPDGEPLQDCYRAVNPRVIVSGTINLFRKDGFIPTRMVSVTYGAASALKK
jgi:hypothetical protein